MVPRLPGYLFPAYRSVWLAWLLVPCSILRASLAACALLTLLPVWPDCLCPAHALNVLAWLPVPCSSICLAGLAACSLLALLLGCPCWPACLFPVHPNPQTANQSVLIHG